MSELKLCPFCGGDAFISMNEFPSKYCKHKREIPAGARLIKKTTFASGVTSFEYREKAFVPQCLQTGCIGRTYKMFHSASEAAAAWNRRATHADP